MLGHNNFFETKHPILCLPMNGVSDVNLAIAVSKAGAVPSFSLPNYMKGMGKYFNKYDLIKDVYQFCSETNSSNIVISMTDFHLSQQYDFLYELYKKYKIKHIEMLIMSKNDTHYEMSQEQIYLQRMREFQQMGVKILVKSISYPKDIMHRFKSSIPIMDGLIIKGREGAGKVNTEVHDESSSLKVISYKAVRNYPSKAIIPSGGICTAEDVYTYMKIGCAAVGIGTLFALSEESVVAKSSKLEIIANNKRKLDNLMCEGMSQNAFVFSEYEGKDNSNHSASLKLGVLGNGGHLFMGAGMSVVDEILPVSEIINRLTNFNVSAPSRMDSVG